MKRTMGLLMVLFISLFLVSSPQAAASVGRVQIETQEQIRLIADLPASGPNGEKLFLGRRIIQRAILFIPYSVQDEGFVIGIENESAYYQIPDLSVIKVMQDKGQLPSPLPEWSFSLWDQIVGHLMFTLLIGFILIATIASIPTSKSQLRSHCKHRPSKKDLLKTLPMFCILAAFVGLGIHIIGDGEDVALGWLFVLFGGWLFVLILTLLILRFVFEIRRCFLLLMFEIRRYFLTRNDRRDS